ncbi:hypothetical protein [Oceanimonas smirnovii]|uniref:hypothetical protein n=1 Tax=Oceanimonas smirnovii TaxID=264574 RepID=UPI00376F69F2
MLTQEYAKILQALEDGQFANGVDESVHDVNMDAFEELWRVNMIKAIDAGSMDGRCYLSPKITISGRQALVDYHEQKKGWWLKLNGWQQVLSVLVGVATIVGAIATVYAAVK